jgi:hypothetical protein
MTDATAASEFDAGTLLRGEPLRFLLEFGAISSKR